MVGVIAPLPADCFTLDEVARVCRVLERIETARLISTRWERKIDAPLSPRSGWSTRGLSWVIAAAVALSGEYRFEPDLRQWRARSRQQGTRISLHTCFKSLPATESSAYDGHFACVTRSPELLKHLDVNIRAVSQTQPQGEASKRQLCWLFVKPPGHHTIRSNSLPRSRALPSLTEAKRNL